MSTRYSCGWSDPRAMYGAFKDAAFKLYGKDYGVNTIGKLFMKTKKVDAHKYETEAKDLDIQVIHDLWQVKYGSGKITAEELANQDTFTWECGNRLWWAGYLTQTNAPDIITECYILLDEPDHANHR